MSDLKHRKIIVDNKIPYLSGRLEPFFEVEYLPAKEFSAERIKQAQALIVRTTIQCNEQLLQQTPVKLITTATIGFDHIDIGYCRQQQIQWHNAPGCNARSVAQYIAAALALLRQQGSFDYQNRTLGIIGLGHVGHQVAQNALALGLHVIAYDPFLPLSKGKITLTDLSTLCQEADIISFHTPLTRPGQSSYPTLHLADEHFFNSLLRSPLIINSARGGVVCEKSLCLALEQGKACGAIIDCWENEPSINPLLLKKAKVATPHIAGYSADGKWNGTRQSLENICRFFKLPIVEPTQIPPIEHSIIDLYAIDSDQQIDHALLSSYPYLRSEIDDLQYSPTGFHSFRDNYRLRREPLAYIIRGAAPENIESLQQLGFQL